MKFRLSPTFVVDTDLAPWNTEGLRIGLWGGSGCGKSSTAALLAEQFLSQSGTLVVFEPRAEYQTLKEKFDVVVCGGPYGKDIDFVPSSPATYAKAVVEQGVSIIFYTTDVEDEKKLVEFISRFLYYLLKYNEVVRRPIMVITEETEEYAPLSTKGRASPPWVFSTMIRQFRILERDARKLNIVPISLSPRPQEVAFTIRQLCNLTFYGKFSPQDATYVDRECLKPLRDKGLTTRDKEDLLNLATGHFLTIHKVTEIISVTQPRLTKHGAVTPKLEYEAPRTEETKKAVTDLTETIQKALEKERLEESKLEKEGQRAKKLEEVVEAQTKEIERLKQTAETLGKIKIETSQPQVPIKPEMDMEKVRDFLGGLRGELIETFDKETDVFLGKTHIIKEIPTAETEKLYTIWAPKMPSLCAKRMFKFLLDNKGARYTKSQIGVSLGYKTSSGTFNGAIAFLRQNNLIRYDGQYLWME